MSAWHDAFDRVPELLLSHVQVSFAALALGITLSVPLAVAAHRNRWFAGTILGLASLVQTIPSLALLALFFPLLVAFILSMCVASPIDNPARFRLLVLISFSLSLLGMVTGNLTGLSRDSSVGSVLPAVLGLVQDLASALRR